MNYCELLKSSKSIVVVGISDKPDRDSGQIALFLKNKGFEVVGVHPTLRDVFGITVYPSLDDVPGTPDIINVFLASERIPAIMPAVIAKKPKALWLQLGVINAEAMELAQQAGILGIEDTCIAIEARRCF